MLNIFDIIICANQFMSNIFNIIVYLENVQRPQNVATFSKDNSVNKKTCWTVFRSTTVKFCTAISNYCKAIHAANSDVWYLNPDNKK